MKVHWAAEIRPFITASAAAGTLLEPVSRAGMQPAASCGLLGGGSQVSTHAAMCPLLPPQLLVGFSGLSPEQACNLLWAVGCMEVAKSGEDASKNFRPPASWMGLYYEVGCACGGAGA